MAYKVKLDNFQGPFDLLVYLIENARMSIYDIKVAEITEQYLAYMEELEHRDVAVSSEFLVLAAELIDLKSKMLLPRLNEDGEEDDTEDPRSSLVSRILEYKQFKLISQMLQEREARGRLIMEKPQEDISEYEDNPEEHLIGDEEQFVKSFKAMLHRRKKSKEIHERYERAEKKRITAEQRRKFIMDLFREGSSGPVPFDDLVPKKEERYDVVLSFSSLMEMVRERRLNADQESLFATILVKKGERFDVKETEEEHVDN